MSETYLGSFGLRDAPFTKEIADTDLWLPASKTIVAVSYTHLTLPTTERV